MAHLHEAVVADAPSRDRLHQRHRIAHVEPLELVPRIAQHLEVVRARVADDAGPIHLGDQLARVLRESAKALVAGSLGLEGLHAPADVTQDDHHAPLSLLVDVAPGRALHPGEAAVPAPDPLGLRTQLAGIPQLRESRRDVRLLGGMHELECVATHQLLGRVAEDRRHVGAGVEDAPAGSHLEDRVEGVLGDRLVATTAGIELTLAPSRARQGLPDPGRGKGDEHPRDQEVDALDPPDVQRAVREGRLGQCAPGVERREPPQRRHAQRARHQSGARPQQEARDHDEHQVAAPGRRPDPARHRHRVAEHAPEHRHEGPARRPQPPLRRQVPRPDRHARHGQHDGGAQPLAGKEQQREGRPHEGHEQAREHHYVERGRDPLVLPIRKLGDREQSAKRARQRGHG